MTTLASALFAMVCLVLSTPRAAMAGNTTVVISVSIGGGVAVGMVGWVIHLTYSQRIAQQQEPSDMKRAEADPWIDKRVLRRREPNWQALYTPGETGGARSWEEERVPSGQTAMIRFVNLPW